MSQSPFSGLQLFAATHAAATAASAFLSPHLPGSRSLSIAVWVIGGFAIFVAVTWRAARAWHHRDPVYRYIASALLALAVTVVSLLISFVVMIDVWEWQGYGH